VSDSPALIPEPREPVVRPRRWRWLKLGCAVVAAGLVSSVAWLFIDRELTQRSSERELTAVRTELENSNPDWTWERLNAARPHPPAEKNGAELIPRIKLLTHPDWGKAVRNLESASHPETPPNVRYAPAIIAQVQRDLELSADAVQLARTLKDCPLGHRDVVLPALVFDAPLDETQQTRHVAHLLRWEVEVAVEVGDARRAADGLLALLNASRSVGDEPFPISQLVRIAVRAVTVRGIERAIAQRSDIPLVELQNALAADAEEPLFLYGVRGDRAAFDRFYENVLNDEIAPEDVLPDYTPLSWWRYRTTISADRAATLRCMNRYVEIAHRPVHEQHAILAAVPEIPTGRRYHLSNLLLMSGSINRFADAYRRSATETRCAVVGVACERFRQQHKRWPESLNDLVPVFLPAVPLDPYNGEPLRYAKLNDGVVVHSVGKWPPKSNAGFGLPDPPEQIRPAVGIDYGFRLWDPDRRRLPPLPDRPAPEVP
jgi:hypothetical protein